jgi:hypothetical protein
MMALAVTFLICVALFFLTSGFFGLVLVMGGGIFAFAALHYVVWGWWLGNVIRADVAEEEAENERMKAKG